MNSNILKVTCLLALAGFSLISQAQNDAAKLSKKEISQAIESTAELLHNNYVYPEKAKKIAKHLKKNLKRGAYNTINDPMLLAEKIQHDIVSVVNDTHLIFEFNPEFVTHLRQDDSKL